MSNEGMFFFDKQQLIYNVAWNTESTKGRCLCPVSQTDKLYSKYSTQSM